MNTVQKKDSNPGTELKGTNTSSLCIVSESLRPKDYNRNPVVQDDGVTDSTWPGLPGPGGTMDAVHEELHN